jgi:phosphoglycolate phosphatase
MKLIGIDLDGTIEDSRDDMVAVARRVRERFGLPARDDTQLRPFVNAGMDQLYRACFDDYLAEDLAHYETVRHAYESDYLENVAVTTRMYEGMAEALTALATLGALACITNKPEKISRRLLDALGVAAHFSAVIGGDSGPHIKPHPSMLEAAAIRCGFDRERGRAFMIGDSTGDVLLGRAFGARTVFCRWGYAERSAEAPDHVALHPRDLAAIIAD